MVKKYRLYQRKKKTSKKCKCRKQRRAKPKKVKYLVGGKLISANELKAMMNK